MSVRAITWSWEQQIPPNGKILLVALADHAHDDGRNAYPSVATMCSKTGLSRSTVQRLLTSLVNEGIISVQQTGGADGRTPTVYALNIEESFAVSKRDFNRSFCPPSLRDSTILRDGHTCQLECGRAGTQDEDPDGNAWEIDRVQAGGRYEESNVRLSCRSCNRKRWSHREGPHAEAPPGGLMEGGSGASSVRPEPSTNPTTTTTTQGGEVTDRRRESRIPTDWQPTPETVAKVREVYPNVDHRRAHERYVNHHRMKGTKAVDWDAGFVMWVQADDERRVEQEPPPEAVRYDDVTGWPINPKPMEFADGATSLK